MWVTVRLRKRGNAKAVQEFNALKGVIRVDKTLLKVDKDFFKG
jgi:hypothetical protein